jgi:TonB family protein
MNGVILVSLFLHAAVLSLLFFTPSFPSPKLTFGPVYTVSLVNFSGNIQQQKKTPAAVKELLEAPRFEKALKKVLEPEPVVPIRSLESRGKKDQTLEKAMDEIRKRAAASGSTPKLPAQVAPAVKTGPAQPPSSPPPSSPGDAEMNAKINAYTAMIWTRIKRGWVFPQGILPGDVPDPVIVLTILRSGAVTAVNFKKRSGNRFVDDSVFKAIRRASPFPPLPASISEASEDVEIIFRLSELRS